MPAYDEYTAERISRLLDERGADYFEKKMFGGLCYMVEDKMCIGLLHNKEHKTDFLLARIGEAECPAALGREGVRAMDFSGRPFKGYVFATPEAYDLEEDLAHWVELCLRHNPAAKASKKRPPKKR